jgi:predicted permease
MGMSDLWAAILALAPTVLMGLLFWYIMRALIRSDKSERRALARIEAEERSRLGLPSSKPAE